MAQAHGAGGEAHAWLRSVTAGALAESELEPAPRCAACNSPDVAAASGALRFCSDCLEAAHRDELSELYDDLGGGD